MERKKWFFKLLWIQVRQRYTMAEDPSITVVVNFFYW